jgi:hypothetical protein
LTAAVEELANDELLNDIGPSKSLIGKELPEGAHPIYLKASETAGSAPEYGVMVESCMGAKTVNATEYSTNGTSSAGSSSTRASLEMGSNEEDNFEIGQAVLVKDGSNGYAIRNVYSVDSPGNQLDLNFNLDNAPNSGTALGKAVTYKPTATGHPYFSAWMYRANGGGIEAIRTCRTTAMNFNITAGQQIEADFSYAGSEFYFNPIEITSSNKYIDITDDGGTIEVVLDEKVYKSPIALATAIATKATAASVGSGDDTFSCVYKSIGTNKGKFVLESDGSTFSLLWNSGTNSVNSTGATLGFSVAADDTGSTSYTSDNEITYSASYFPSYDDATNLVAKSNEVMIGGFDDNICRKAQSVSISVATPVTDVESICASSGVSEKLILSREVTMTTTLIFQKHEAELFDRLLNGTSTSIMVNVGSKDSAGNWEAGKCVNFYLANATITGHVIGGDDFITVELSAKGYVDSTRKDLYINFL